MYLQNSIFMLKLEKKSALLLLLFLLDDQLARDVKQAVDANDIPALKTLLENPSFNLGAIDNAAVEIYRTAINDYRTNNPGVEFTLDMILTALSGEELLAIVITILFCIT